MMKTDTMFPSSEVHKIEVGNGRSLILAARLGNCLSL